MTRLVQALRFIWLWLWVKLLRQPLRARTVVGLKRALETAHQIGGADVVLAPGVYDFSGSDEPLRIPTNTRLVGQK